METPNWYLQFGKARHLVGPDDGRPSSSATRGRCSAMFTGILWHFFNDIRLTYWCWTLGVAGMTMFIAMDHSPIPCPAIPAPVRGSKYEKNSMGTSRFQYIPWGRIVAPRWFQRMLQPCKAEESHPPFIEKTPPLHGPNYMEIPHQTMVSFSGCLVLGRWDYFEYIKGCNSLGRPKPLHFLRGSAPCSRHQPEH